MRTRWRLLDLPPLTAAENMALDAVLVELRGQGHSTNTLRFLRFRPASVLLGYHQAVQEEVRESYCRAHGIDINRRITGGGGLLFDESQLGWEIICDKAFFGVTVPNTALFRTLCEPTIAALRTLGIEASFRPRNDIEVNGRKISGTGGTDSDSAFLFQGTLLMDFDVETMLKCLRIPVEKLKDKEIASVRQRVTCLAWELGREPDCELVKARLVEAFAEALDADFVPGGLTAEEEDLLAQKLPYFQSEEWINMVRPSRSRTEVVQAARKSPYGLVRVTLQVDMVRNTVKDIFITGDFLSFPGRALYDLESVLRGKRLVPAELGRLVEEFFARGSICIPDMGPKDILAPLGMALAKVEIARAGIPLEWCNRINSTCASFAKVLELGVDALLLPYSAKDPACELRHEDYCTACGLCSVGEAWQLGLSRNLQLVCITNFEHLQAELVRLKASGCRAFVGCCCQQFFVKHTEDFAAIGLPGILVDIEDTTCYELGEENAAYKGTFARQTSVNMDLLMAIFAASDRLGGRKSDSRIERVNDRGREVCHESVQAL